MSDRAQRWKDRVSYLDGILLDLEAKRGELLKAHTINAYAMSDSLSKEERIVKLNETWSEVTIVEERISRTRVQRMEAFMNWAETTWDTQTP